MHESGLINQLGVNVISPVPQDIVARYNLDTRWYSKYLDAYGIPILGSSNLSNNTMIIALSQLSTLLRTWPFWSVPRLNQQNARVVFFARNERASSIPEFYNAFGTSLDDFYWAGFGGTPSFPITGGAEIAPDIFIHEFGHTLDYMALRYIDPNFSSELGNAYNNAMGNGLWRNTYAGSNVSEYWAEGVRIYFDVGGVGPPGGNGVYNDVFTRNGLFNYDRQLFNLLNRVYQGATFFSYLKYPYGYEEHPICPMSPPEYMLKLNSDSGNVLTNCTWHNH